MNLVQKELQHLIAGIADDLMAEEWQEHMRCALQEIERLEERNTRLMAEKDHEKWLRDRAEDLSFAIADQREELRNMLMTGADLVEESTARPQYDYDARANMFVRNANEILKG